MNRITSTNVATAITKLVACDALPALVGNLTAGNLALRDFEPQIAQCGDVVNVPSVGGHSLVTLATHAEAVFQVPDVTKVLAVPDLLRLYMQPAVVALAEKIECDLLRCGAQFTNAAVGTSGTLLTKDVVESAGLTLFAAKVATNQPKYLVVDGASYSAMRQMPRFSEYGSAWEAGLREMVDGPVGKLGDFYVLRSQFVPKTGSSPMATHNVAFAKGALGLAIRRLPQPLPGTGAIAEYAELGHFGMRVVMSYQPNTLAQQFTIDLLYGVAALQPNYGVEVLS